MVFSAISAPRSYAASLGTSLGSNWKVFCPVGSTSGVRIGSPPILGVMYSPFSPVKRFSISPLFEIPDHSVDRIIMINAFGDINPLAALKVFRRILKPTGLFRANVLSREIKEKYCFGEDLFDRETGYFYHTHKKGIEPIGYITRKDGEKIPFYRMLKSYYRPELDKIFNECGFEIISETQIILPKNVWMNSVAAQGKGRTNTRRMELIDKLGGHPGSVDIIAKPLTNQQMKGRM